VPVVEDWWQHEFNPIKTSDSCSFDLWQHHLEKELAKENSDNENGKNQNTLKSQRRGLLSCLSGNV
jgi:hypothetical protein